MISTSLLISQEQITQTACLLYKQQCKKDHHPMEGMRQINNLQHEAPYDQLEKMNLKQDPKREHAPPTV